MTRYPTVAWTKTTCPNLSPALVADHSYSILGTFENGASRYIVLRNPWGTLQYRDPASLAQAGAYQPLNVTPRLLSALVPQKGIFAIENAAFNTYFGGFGWVKY